MCRKLLCLLITLLLCAQFAIAGPYLQPSQSTPLAPEQTFVILQIEQPGRYAIQASSAQGTAIQLVDKLKGPRQIAGESGQKDGRVDAFLEAGLYKVNVFQASRVHEAGKLSLFAFSTTQTGSLQPHKLFQNTLKDRQQHTYDLIIKQRRTVLIEAAGRNLVDMRLWENADWLINHKATLQTSEPISGQRLTTAHLVADLNPGHYQLKLYGGNAHVWSQNTAQHPVYLRMGIPTLPTNHQQQLTTSPFGVDRWLVPRNATYFNLSLPEAADASLTLSPFKRQQAYQQHGRVYTLARKQKVSTLRQQHHSQTPYTLVSVRQQPGQAFRLQHFQKNAPPLQNKNAHYWIGLLQENQTGAEPPLTSVIFEQYNKRVKIVDTRMIELSRKQGFKTQFNVDQPSQKNPSGTSVELFIHIKKAGKYLLIGSGPEADYALEPLLYKQNHKIKQRQWQNTHGIELATGHYILHIRPKQGGVLKLTLQPRNPQQFQTQIPSYYAKQYLHKRKRYTIRFNETRKQRGIIQKQWPLTLDQPLLVMQPNQAINMTVQTDQVGRLVAQADGKVISVLVNGKKRKTIQPGKHRIQITVPMQTAALQVRFEPTIKPAPAIQKTVMPHLSTETPVFFDLNRQQRRSFDLDIQQAGVYRIESTGLLAIKGNIRTPMIPSLWQGNKNGIGRNFLLQRYLPMGHYQLTVETQGLSQGHLGVQLSANPLKRVTLGLSQTHRSTLAAGEGIVYAFTITEADEYDITVNGLNRQYPLRLEDHEGWPLRITQNNTFKIKLQPGQYRLFAAPQAVENRILAHIAQKLASPTFKGHGPHTVSLNQSFQHRWLEPDNAAERTPDQWAFTLNAATTLNVHLDDTMTASLTGDALTTPMILPRHWKGALAPGRYTLHTQAARKNNRLDYTFKLESSDILPGQYQHITLPGEASLSIAQTGWYQISSEGDTDVQATLYDSHGQVVAHNDDRKDDWNFLISTGLSAGKYTLKLTSNQPTPAHTASQSARVNVHQIQTVTQAPLTSGQTFTLPVDGQTHVFPLQTVDDTELLVVHIEGAPSVQLRLEQRQGKQWHTISQVAGTAPLLAYVVDPTSTQKYRLSLWSDTQRSTSVQVTYHALKKTALTSTGSLHTGLSLAPITPNLSASRITLPHPPVTHQFEQTTHPVWWADTKQRAAHRMTQHTLPVQSDVFWLLQSGPTETLRAQPIQLANDSQQTIWVEQSAHFQVSHSDAAYQVITATSPITQPALSGAMALQNKTALTLLPKGSDINVQVWRPFVTQASPTAIQLHTHNISATPDADTLLYGPQTLTAPPKQATRYPLPEGTQQLSLALAAQTAVALVHNTIIQRVFWAHQHTQQVELTTNADHLVLLNLSASNPAQNHVTLMPATPWTLTADRLLHRRFNTPAELHLAVKLTTRTSAYVHFRGPVEQARFVGDNGHIIQGQSPLHITQSGTLQFTHDTGLFATWLTDHASPMRPVQAAITPSSAITTLSGQQMAFHLKRTAAHWVYLQTHDPLLVQIQHGEKTRTLFLPHGIQRALLLPKGDASLSLTALAGALSGAMMQRQDLAKTVQEGLNPRVLLAPGQSQWYQLHTEQPQQDIGLGLKASHESVSITLYAVTGEVLGEGIVQLHQLPKGTYFIELMAPHDLPPIRAQLATVGVIPPDGQPPETVLKTYLAH